MIRSRGYFLNQSFFASKIIRSVKVGILCGFFVFSSFARSNDMPQLSTVPFDPLAKDRIVEACWKVNKGLNVKKSQDADYLSSSDFESFQDLSNYWTSKGNVMLFVFDPQMSHDLISRYYWYGSSPSLDSLAVGLSLFEKPNSPHHWLDHWQDHDSLVSKGVWKKMNKALMTRSKQLTLLKKQEDLTRSELIEISDQGYAMNVVVLKSCS